MADPFESQTLIAHLGDQVDPSDIVRIVLGYYDKNSNKFVPGLVSSVADLEKGRKYEARINRFILYFIAILLGIEFLGLNRFADLVKLISGHP